MVGLLVASRFVLLLALLLRVSAHGPTVSVTQDCYEKNPASAIEVVFEHSFLDDDWFAFAPATKRQSFQTLATGDFEAWSWKCGDSWCSIADGSILVPNSLPEGDWVVIAAHNAQVAPYQGYAVSSVFEIKNSCDNAMPTVPSRAFEATETPTRKPTFVIKFGPQPPTKMPTDSPVKEPTEAPVPDPTPSPTKVLTRKPTSAPVPAPVPTPVPTPVAAPPANEAPTRKPTFSLSMGVGPASDNELAFTQMLSARADIEEIIANDQPMAAKFLRLIFHDCIGGCDGKLFAFVSLDGLTLYP